MGISLKDVSSDRIHDLSRGRVAAFNLMEQLAVDWSVLIPEVLPRDLARRVRERIGDEKSITRRMKLAGEALAHSPKPMEVLERYTAHPSDTVRGWLCYLVAALERETFREYLDLIEPFADDPHFGVREWAWIAVRPHVARDVDGAIRELSRWSESPSVNLRRYTTEITRPRGVWCHHLAALKAEPWRGEPLLEPLKADPEKYVQDSVANWLNDATRTSPQWVMEIVACWEKTSPTNATHRIARRALRTINKKK
ncbi:MAG: DNA alkylation repair protein [Candidatus Sumerlaeia bacterium]|nr:DNA alkylation repair protein [Candidatus Sumerlaeia bacterium]